MTVVLQRWWLPVFGAVVGAVLPYTFFSTIVGPLVTLIGLMIAGILPAATLTVNAMKPGLSTKRLSQLRLALRWQIIRWAALFFFAIFCAGLLIMGQALSWHVYEVKLDWLWLEKVELAQLLPILILFSLGYIVGNVGSVFSGILRILDILYEVAAADAEKRLDDLTENVELEVKSMPDRPGFGSYVEH